MNNGADIDVCFDHTDLGESYTILLKLVKLTNIGSFNDVLGGRQIGAKTIGCLDYFLKKKIDVNFIGVSIIDFSKFL